MKKIYFSYLKKSIQLLGVLIIGGGIYYACSKKTDCCVVANLTASFDLRGKNGTSIFDSTNTSFVSNNRMQVLYLNQAGQYEPVNRPNLETPHGFIIEHENGTKDYVLHVQLNDYTENDTSYTLLKIDRNNTDTIKALVNQSQIQNLWWNDSLLSMEQYPYRIGIDYLQ